MKRFFLFSFALLAPLFASAVPITFTHTGFGSGSIGGVSFSDSAITFTSFGDTDDRQDEVTDVFYIDHESSFVTIEGLGVFEMLSGTRTFVNHFDSGIVGYSRADFGGLDLFNGPINDLFTSWDMLSSTGLITGISNFLQWTGFSDMLTDGGILYFDSIQTESTFEATVVSVPEPSSVFLFVLGAAGLIWGRRNLS